ncbi:MAG: hypothetical protein AABZ44_00450, partial [Elusimicrobiota bacterium]
MPENLLSISLSWNDTQPPPGAVALGRFHGGRRTLLQWLETQLGLPFTSTSQALRILHYAKLLQSKKQTAYSDSLAADLWGTSRNLLDRRDDLRLLGWDGKDNKDLPPLVRDLAAIEKAGDLLLAGEAERLSVVLAALAAG